jgi:hypothetical protein
MFAVERPVGSCFDVVDGGLLHSIVVVFTSFSLSTGCPRCFFTDDEALSGRRSRSPLLVDDRLFASPRPSVDLDLDRRDVTTVLLPRRARIRSRRSRNSVSDGV